MSPFSHRPKRSPEVCGAHRYHDGEGLLEMDYVVTKRVVGTGSFGQVVLVEDKRDFFSQQAPKTFACKTCLKPNVRSGRGVVQQRRQRNELEIYLRLDHPNIVKLYDVYETPTHVHFVMELCSGGELYQRYQMKPYTERDAQVAVHDMLLAVQYLHDNRIIHRDLKTENFLYEDSSPNARLKLIDFGLAEHAPRRTKLEEFCGSALTIAPEVFAREYDKQCDIWSLGVCTYFLLFGKYPFVLRPLEPATALEPTVRAANYDRAVFRQVSDTARSFVEALLTVDPSKRCTAGQALQHPWITNRPGTRTLSLVKLDVVEDIRSVARTSALCRACLNVAVQCISDDKVASLRKALLGLDNGNGAVTLKALVSALEQVADLPEASFLAQLEQAKDERIMDKLISYSEFLEAMLHSKLCDTDCDEVLENVLVYSPPQRAALGQDG